ncbi:GyrI-like domain-containing protein [Pelotalea chapellei]|uniref:GyrI-like domain-containing protein n=1 Tax=Pelotalea chapellei TaxID=44671 RepID=UPI003461B1A4
MTKFSVDNKDMWKWNAMIMQPEFVTTAVLEEAIAQVKKKKKLPALPLLRLQEFHEGKAVQTLHIGPYSEEGPTIQTLHETISKQGKNLAGKHHEIYLSDPTRTAPDKLKTILRQPFA